MDNGLKRVLRGFLTIGVIVAIAILVGVFFAFGGNNPILIHMGNIIDMVLVAVTVLFLMAVAYKLYAMVTGSRDPIVASQKRKNQQASKNKSKSNDELPELTELIENLDATE